MAFNIFLPFERALGESSKANALEHPGENPLKLEGGLLTVDFTT